ncbi:phage portal protein [Vineibacter terrae]|nr:phage portal protein [Vineibacter terrae]
MMAKPRYRVAAGSAPLPRQASIDTGLEAGRTGRRLSTWLPTRAHVNTLIAGSGGTVLARSRYLGRNNGYAAGAIEAWASASVATGIMPAWKVKGARQRKKGHELWRAWTDESDAEGLTDFYGQTRRASRELYIAGEVFFRKRPRLLSDGLTVPLQLQMLPSEMLDPNFTTTAPNGNAIRQGIEFDRIGRRVAYHFWQEHPGDTTVSLARSGERVRVPASEVIHVLDPVEAGQIRGLTRFSAAMVKLWVLDGYDDAELERKKTAALHAGFVTRTDPDGDLYDKAAEEAAKDADGIAVPTLEPGTMKVLLPGEDVKFSTPADSGSSYEPFQYRTLLQVFMALGIPYYEGTGDLKQANYSSLRQGMLKFRRSIEAFQHSVLVFQLCRTVWRWFLDAAVLAGALDLPDYASNPKPYLVVEWIPPKWEWVDPFKDIKAEILAIVAGLKARSSVIKAMGGDPEQVDEDRRDDRDREQSFGLSSSAPGIGDNGGPPMDDEPGAGRQLNDNLASLMRLVKAFSADEASAAA